MKNKLISITEAIEIIRKNSSQITKTETLDIKDCCGRVTAIPYYSDIDFPPFDKSAMDGFLVTNPDLTEYKIVDLIKAGDKLNIRLKDHECVAIMTGAPILENGVKVIINEHTTINEEKIIVTKQSSALNICRKGEDLKKGDVVLPQKSLINPFSIGGLAGAGIDKVEVLSKIKIDFAVTGDELLDVKEIPTDGMIRDTNSYSLTGRIKNIPFCEGQFRGIVKDTLDDTKNIIDNFFNSDSNILILSGGSSRGDFDFVVAALQSLDWNILIEGVRIQPGKPVIFATKGDKIVFGLPGNPVSVLVSFEVFIKEALYAMMGLVYKPLNVTAQLTTDYSRKNVERTSFIPVDIQSEDIKMFATPVKYNGSGHITSYNFVNYLMVVQEGVSLLKKGDLVIARQIWQNY
ncbi:MAG: hypothetical protein A2086_09870 [Spirochaetes bacterium GWD1_27_9]|nr:MAG: hypothetical protein A2Z98_08635 [Spirochaetes bacterium GWB1_27_13]OHD26500.1 MAG: hypothetical protein A2Y34_12875 [Spirochaetes bacterium GWC1_27_15]OHD42041.1 MAG: hypothetical protein A2086_09870 [Spirochaetes bacterium GWD1_27_9]